MSNSNVSLINRSKEIIPMLPHHNHSTRNLKFNSKNSEISRINEKKDNYKMKFSYIPKNYNDAKNYNENINNALEKKCITCNSKSRDNLNNIYKEKNINFSNNKEKRNDIISIFDAKKLLIKHSDKIPNNFIFISNNSRKNSKGNIVIYNKNKKNITDRYHVKMHNNTFNTNSIIISNKVSPENKGKHLTFVDKNQRNIDKDKGRLISLEDIPIINKKVLKKSLSKQNYMNDNINNNDSNRISNIGQSDYNKSFNTEKIKKFKSLKPNDNKDLYYFQSNSPRSKEITLSSKSNIQSYIINIKDNSKNNDNKNAIIPNYLKIDRKCEKKNDSKSKRTSGDNRIKRQVNNNNININNVFINLENKDKYNFNNESEYRQFIKEDFKKKSFSKLLNKSNSNKDLNLKNNQIVNNIKQLWKKIGGVTEHYKNIFIEKLNYLNNDDKFYFYMREKEQINNLLVILEKLNKNIKIRNTINSQLKSINSNNHPKTENISKLLISLRMITINIINDYINFKKKISYDILNNKYILANINSYPYHYLFQIENDTNYLYSHAYLSNIYKFSKYSDPFLINPSRECKDKNKYIILPINDYTLQEIQKANYFLFKEKINKEERKRSMIKSPINYCNNAILIRNNNIVKKYSENKKSQNYGKNKFDNILICPIININIENTKNSKKINFSIYRNSLSIFNNKANIFNENLKICMNITDFIIKNNDDKNRKNNKYNKNIILSSKVADLEIINNNKNKQHNNINIFKNINFEIFNIPKKKQEMNLYKFCPKIINIEIKNENYNLNNKKNKINDDIKGIENINSNNNQKSPGFQNNDVHQENNPSKDPIQKNFQENIFKNIPDRNMINQEVCPFDSKSYPPIELIYNSYLKTVNDDIKISFKINPNIYYYSSIGASPKIILFKQNKSILYGMATLSYDSSQIYHKALMITSISCSNNYSIANTLLQLVDYCDREIEYDELILFLYFYQNELKKGEYLLNEEFKNMIKTQTKFKWTALENTGNERKIRYHYKKSFSSKKNMLSQENNLLKIVKNYTQISFYRFIKYNKTNCEKGLNAKEYTFLFNVINLSLKYGKDPNNNDDVLNLMFSKMNGLKKKRLLKMITEFNLVIYDKVNAFVEELGKNEDKKLSEILFKKFLPLLKNVSQKKFLGLFYTDISTNFSSIFKKRINGYEYNIISIIDFNIEVFRLSNEQNNEDYNNYLYFFKSENESISFILNELDPSNEKEMENNNYKNDLFNKILKRILTKDNEEPVKYFKKIGIPSFRYHPNFKAENEIQYKLTDYDILDGDDWFDFCIENNNNINLFSFPENKEINEDIKIIENSFAIAIINPDLTVDYHIPALNIYYINKNCWIKR